LQFCDPQLAAEIDPGRKRVVRLDPRDLSRIYLERPEGDYLTVPLRRRDLPGMSWWEWRAIRKQSRRAARQGAPQPEKPAILLELEQRPRLTPETELKRRRLASRRAEWQALRVIQALPVANVSLQPVIDSGRNDELPSWEILE
jgi:hypothetical protein